MFQIGDTAELTTVELPRLTDIASSLYVRARPAHARLISPRRRMHRAELSLLLSWRVATRVQVTNNAKLNFLKLPALKNVAVTGDGGSDMIVRARPRPRSADRARAAAPSLPCC